MQPRLKPLRDQVIVVTGATSGIGLATALMATRAGASLVAVARDEEALQVLCRQIEDDGGKAAYAVADVAMPEQLEKAAGLAEERFGGFDTWVNNAGAGIYANLMDLPIEEHRRLFETNYWGVVNGSTIAVRALQKRPGGGALINMGSINSNLPIPLLSAYAASKHAVQGYTNSLRMELIHDGSPVSVTLIKPSGIATPFPQRARNHMEDEAAVAPPLYAPEVVARAILHAAEHRTRATTVGGGGRLMDIAAAVAPKLTDRLFAYAMPKLGHTGQRKTEGNDLFSAQADGDLYWRNSRGRSFSSYNAAGRHPVLSLAVAAVGGVVLAGLLSRRS